jgi:hypothetical protein
MQIQIANAPVYSGQTTQTSIGTATALVVSQGSVVLGQGATFSYSLLDADGNLIGSPGTCQLTADQYANWTGDDIWVAQKVAANLGLTPV